MDIKRFDGCDSDEVGIWHDDYYSYDSGDELYDQPKPPLKTQTTDIKRFDGWDPSLFYDDSDDDDSDDSGDELYDPPQNPLTLEMIQHIRHDQVEDFERLAVQNKISDLSRFPEKLDYTSPLYMSVQAHAWSIFEFLLQQNIDIDVPIRKRGYTLFNYTLKTYPRNHEFAEMLLAKGAEVHFKDAPYVEATPICRAMRQGCESNGYASDIKELFEKMASKLNFFQLNSKFNGLGYLHYEWTPPEFLSILIAHGANPNLKGFRSMASYIHDKDSAANTALNIVTYPLHEHAAAVDGYSKPNMNVLIENGANIDARNGFQMTPLEVMFFQINAKPRANHYIPKIVKCLLKRGANPELMHNLEPILSFLKNGSALAGELNYLLSTHAFHRRLGENSGI